MSGLVGQTKGLGFSLTTLELSLVQGLTQGSDTERFFNKSHMLNPWGSSPCVTTARGKNRLRRTG